jgi:hypothetical protein
MAGGGDNGLVLATWSADHSGNCGPDDLLSMEVVAWIL